MRLIDADALLEKMKQTNRYFDVKFDIDSQPTAYDVEKVVAEIKDDFSDINFAYNDCSRLEWLENIVKRGGVE